MVRASLTSSFTAYSCILFNGCAGAAHVLWMQVWIKVCVASTYPWEHFSGAVYPVPYELVNGKPNGFCPEQALHHPGNPSCCKWRNGLEL